MILKDKVDMARWYVLQNVRVYGALSQFHKDRFDEAVPTACTDGEFITWGEAYVKRLPDKQVRFVLLHETFHCIFRHIWRFDPKDPRSNQACDYEINGKLIAMAKQYGWEIEMPPGGLYDPQYESDCAEDIFAKLPKSPQGNEKDYVDVCGGFTTPAKIKKPESQQPQSQSAPVPDSTLEEKWIRATVQAAQIDKALKKGDTPSEIERLIAASLTSPPNWESAMAEFAKTAMSQKNDWTQAARRHVWQKVIYPRKKFNQIGLIILANDTSGSVGEREFAAFKRLAENCLAETNCSAIVIDCDAEIHREIEVEPGDSLPDRYIGGGGTDFRPVFLRAQELKDQESEIAGIIYLTDLDGNFPEQEPGIPTLWLSTTDRIAPFGQTVKIII